MPSGEMSCPLRRRQPRQAGSKQPRSDCDDHERGLGRLPDSVLPAPSGPLRYAAYARQCCDRDAIEHNRPHGSTA